MRAPLLILGAGKKREPSGSDGGDDGGGDPGSTNVQSLPFVETFMYADGSALLASGYADGAQTNAVAPIVDTNMLVASPTASTFLGVDLAAPVPGIWWLMDVRIKRHLGQGLPGFNAYTASLGAGGYFVIQADTDGSLYLSSGCDFNGDFFDGVSAHITDFLPENNTFQLAGFIGTDDATGAACLACYMRPTSGDAWAVYANTPLPDATPSFQPQSLQYGLGPDVSEDVNADRSAILRVEMRAGVLADDPYATGLPA